MSHQQLSQHESKLPSATDQNMQDQKAPESQWSTLLLLLNDRLDEAAEAAKNDISLEEHITYYRAVFAKVREEAASRDDIPNSVMEPPTQTAFLTFHGGWNKSKCLGCLDFHDADDIIHVEVHAKDGEPNGVTKDDLLRCICDVFCGGLHMVHKDSKKETGVVLSSLNWMGTTPLCNILDNIVYVGYMPERSLEQEKSEQEIVGVYDIVLNAQALGTGISSIQGYDHNYTRTLVKAKGWSEEDWEMFNGL